MKQVAFVTANYHWVTRVGIIVLDERPQFQKHRVQLNPPSKYECKSCICQKKVPHLTDWVFLTWAMWHWATLSYSMWHGLAESAGNVCQIEVTLTCSTQTVQTLDCFLQGVFQAHCWQLLSISIVPIKRHWWSSNHIQPWMIKGSWFFFSEGQEQIR